MQAGNAFKDRYPYLGNKLIQRILKKKKRKEKKNKVRNKKEIERLTRNNKQLHEEKFSSANQIDWVCCVMKTVALISLKNHAVPEAIISEFLLL